MRSFNSLQLNILIWFMVTFLIIHSGVAQEEGGESLQETTGIEAEEAKFAVALTLGYTHIPEARTEGEVTESENLFTIGVDLYYHFSERWKLGAVIDVELENYEVDFEGERLQREYAVVTGVVAGFGITPRWWINVGPGIEFERNKSLFVFRVGMEYGFKIGRSWELFPLINYDFKREYNTYSLGIGIGKRF